MDESFFTKMGGAQHPRPQLQRSAKSWTSLNGPWRFRFDDEQRFESPGEIREWPHTIEVPFAPECTKSGIADAGFHPCCWYEREFDVVSDTGPLLLHFGAVDYAAKVWVNDRYVGSHEGGYTPFSFDIAPFLKTGERQKVTVKALDDPHDLGKPRGKQDWQLEPHSIWYPRSTGIWQTVWLERVKPTFVERIRWTPHLERWEIGFEAFVHGALAVRSELRVKLSLGDKVLANDSYQVIHGEVHRRIALSDPGIDDYRNELLWSPEKPTLIFAEIELWCENVQVDAVFSYTALRSVAVHQDRFLLNGRPYYLRLVLDQGYWLETLLTAPNDEAIRTDIRLTKEMGFNGVRKHQKIEDPRYLFWADVMGLLVWEEMPSAYRFTQESVARIVREWGEVIARDYSHPCIVTWVPFNESWGVPDLQEKASHRHCVQALYHLTKTVDSTRPVVGNDGWESTATDIIGVHDYESNPAHLKTRYGMGIDVKELFGRARPAGRLLTLDGHPNTGQPVVLSEFGGIAFSRPGTPDRKKWGYVVARSEKELEARYQAILRAVTQLPLFSGFCYTQLTDTYQEVNGLLYADRTPKIPLSAIAKVTGNHRYDDAELGVALPNQNESPTDESG